MECKICNKEIKNKGSLKLHEKSCKRKNEIEKKVLDLYLNEFFSINKLSKKYGVGKTMIKEILGENVREHSISVKIAHRLYPESFKHSEETKTKLRDLRLEYMKDNPNETAWRKSNISYSEKKFFNKIKELRWDEKYLIVREYSIFPYFIDFAFVNEKVAVEIDGSQHLLPERKESDKRKDNLLLEKGWRVIRIMAKDINENIENSIKEVGNFLSNGIQSKEVGIIEYKNYKKKCECGVSISSFSERCKKCDNENQRKVERPPYKQLLKEIEELGYTGTGRKYNVSDNSIRKWKKYYEKN